ncbi:nucleopolyhedrovirus P10 family protein [Streptomyces iconiensis]|uniref:Nucleopolyhedrovirus P10 family protein n=1 Tax=Streptomyces iconiensis TaxID=1384038 RepID=A0ABT6ZVG4_9ACTN|nr:nucleopolyhedrovirus P10 family protein [Streptomyces iconiensis]MDJ1133056.1 nucleopolyhedrovirus P10 family protein [Streptomyces iconiensis]
MAADRLTQAVRHQLGLGRLLPLGGADDGAWLTEEAAVAALRAAVADRFPGVRLSDVRLGLTDPEAAAEPAVQPPPTALTPGPLTLTADLAVTADEPLPTLTASLRHALLAAAERELGLALKTVDLRVTDLLEAPESPGPANGEADGEGRPPEGDGTSGESEGPGESGDPAARVAAAVLGVPGVARLAPVLGSPLALTSGGTAARAVRITGPAEDAGTGGGRHVLVQLAVARGHRALDVARAARGAAREAAEAGDGANGKGRKRPDPVTVAALVTAVGLP